MLVFLEKSDIINLAIEEVSNLKQIFEKLMGDKTPNVYEIDSLFFDKKRKK